MVGRHLAWPAAGQVLTDPGVGNSVGLGHGVKHLLVLCTETLDHAYKV